MGGQTLPHQALLSPEGVHHLGIRVGRKQLFINLLLQPLVGPYALSNFVIEDGIGGWRRGLSRHQMRAKNDDFTTGHDAIAFPKRNRRPASKIPLHSLVISLGYGKVKIGAPKSQPTRPYPTQPPVDPEYIPSDYGFQRYYTRAQCRMFINNIFIDEFQTIQWDLSYNLIPKFGYCSSKFDDVANGKSLVQGQLVLNFVSPGYLIGALIGQAPAGASLASEWPVNRR